MLMFSFLSFAPSFTYLINYYIILSSSDFVHNRYSPSGYDFNGASRRKNVTRDSTSTLKAWLNEHRKNPYPTKGEKIMLAIITKMTLVQVSVCQKSLLWLILFEKKAKERLWIKQREVDRQLREVCERLAN